jgi:hypothetical protein
MRDIIHLCISLFYMSKNACKGLQYFDLHFGVSTVSAYNEIVRSFHTQLHRAIHFFY